MIKKLDNCVTCNKELFGRADKVYCSSQCKNKHHSLAKVQTSEIQHSKNKFIKRNYVIITGLLGKSLKKINIHYQQIFNLGFDHKCYDDVVKINGKQYFKIEEYYFKFISENVIEILSKKPEKQLIPEFFNRWYQIFEKMVQNGMKIMGKFGENKELQVLYFEDT